MNQEASQTAECPSELAAVPEGERILEAYGWAPSAWGLGCVCLAWLTLFQPAGLGSREAAILAGSLLLAAGLFVTDIRRRRRPRILYRPGQGPILGIYRDGRLQRTVELARSTVFIRRVLNTWGPLIMLPIWMIACVVFLKEGLGGVTLGERLLPVLVLGFCLALFTTLVKTRLRCEEALFPYPNTPGFEHILVPKAAIKRIFGTRP